MIAINNFMTLTCVFLVLNRRFFDGDRGRRDAIISRGDQWRPPAGRRCAVFKMGYKPLTSPVCPLRSGSSTYGSPPRAPDCCRTGSSCRFCRECRFFHPLRDCGSTGQGGVHCTYTRCHLGSRDPNGRGASRRRQRGPGRRCCAIPGPSSCC